MVAIVLDHNFFNHDAQAGGFFPKTHINPGFDIDSLIKTDGKNILIEGIRGTGKTHILKMIASKCIDNYNELKILPVYISLNMVSEWQGSDIRLFRIQLYANIVSKTIETIENNKTNIGYKKSGTEKAIDILKSMFGIKNNEDIDKILNKVRDINEELLRQLTYNPEKICERSKDEAEIRSGFSTAPPVQLKFEELIRYIEEREIQKVGKTLAFENASKFIIEFFTQLKEILGCQYVFLLLDECSDPSEEAQIEVFRLLKIIRGGITSDMEKNYVYFCASVYPPYATKYPSKILGHSVNFDPGQDAGVEYLQLNELSDDYEEFFLELTRKRLEYVLGRSISDPITEIFENEGAFILASYCANGIPRRYLEILKQGYENLHQRDESGEVSKRISQRDIENAVQIVASSQILTQKNLNTDDFKIVAEIVKRMSTRNKKTETENKDKEKPLPANIYFTINYSQFQEFNNLLLQGCIHDKGRTRLKKYYKEEGSQGPLMMLDLALALSNGAIDKRRAIDIFRKDLKTNAKSGFEYCQDFDLDIFEYKNIYSEIFR
jgi:hypothetical protein